MKDEATLRCVCACCRGFVEHFFQCTECSEHFLQLARDKTAAAVQTREDAVRWMWRTHNLVRPFCILILLCDTCNDW